MPASDYWFEEEPGTGLQAPTAPVSRRPKGHRFEVELDIAEVSDRMQFGPVWTAKARELSRSHLIVLARRMVHVGRSLAIACHLVDDKPVPLFGRVVTCEYIEGSGYRVDLDLMKMSEERIVEAWLRLVMRGVRTE
ncbi:MAG: hypothetical protein R3B68_08195 [Phycisphaerales bacterium]